MDSSEKDKLIQAAKQWISWDPNQGTRSEIRKFLDEESYGILKKKLSKRLQFGTAGIRGEMGAGTNCMNDLVVIQTTQGLCTYLLETLGEKGKTMGIVIGYDHRCYNSVNSKQMAQIIACVCISKGMTVYLFGDYVATPLVPFCVELKRSCAGIMVTASHNPKIDNGYKVYWGNGSQIIPPHDEGIAKEILKNLQPWKNYDFNAVKDSKLLHDPIDDVSREYFKALREKLCRYPEDNAKSDFKVTYTAMHGEGHVWTTKAFKAFALKPYVGVKEQIIPDPEFPTVSFPNPEEGKGVLVLAMQTADENNSSLILANDPDADRLAVAEKQADGSWRVFTGNELGTLLGHWEFTLYTRKNPSADRSKLYFLASTVSSKMLKLIAEAEGINFVETLTGFKWIGNKTEELRKMGMQVLFSFEQAIGFCVGDFVKDKDGISAAAVVTEMAIQLKKQGKNLSEHLADLYKKYGSFISNEFYITCYEPPKIDKIFERLRNNGKYWDSCGEYKIKYIRDLTTGFDNSQPDKKAVLPVSSSSQMITYTFVNGSVVTLRTSGTEPKIKYYVEMLQDSKKTKQENTKEVEKMAYLVVREMLQPKENELEWCAPE